MREQEPVQRSITNDQFVLLVEAEPTKTIDGLMGCAIQT